MQGRHAEIGRHGVRQSPGEHPPRVPVHDRDQVPESFLERDVGDVGRPDVIGVVDHEVSQQVGIDRVRLVRDRRLWLWRKASQSHEAHEPAHPFAVDDDPSTLQGPDHHALSVLGVSEVDLVDQAHQLEVLLALSAPTLVVIGRAGQTQEFTLTRDGES